jgi:hypothetical protein
MPSDQYTLDCERVRVTLLRGLGPIEGLGPIAEAIGYRRRLASIAAATQAEIARTAEQQVAEAGRTVSALVDEVSNNLR